MAHLDSPLDADPDRELWAKVIWLALHDMANRNYDIREAARDWLMSPEFWTVAELAGLDEDQCARIQQRVTHPQRRKRQEGT